MNCNKDTTIRVGDKVRVIREPYAGHEFYVGDVEYITDPEYPVIDEYGGHYSIEDLEIMEPAPISKTHICPDPEDLNDMKEAMLSLREEELLGARCAEWCKMIHKKLDEKDGVYIVDFDEIDEVINPEG